MTRKQRIFAFAGAGLATGLLLAGILVYTLSHTEYGMERVRRFAVSWLTDRVDGTVHIGSLGGHGLFGGVMLRDFYIIDRKGRPFMRADSIELAYDWRTFLNGQIVVDKSAAYNPTLYFEQLPGDTIWNFQHVFPDRSKPGEILTRRLILLHDVRVANGTIIVRIPYDSIPQLSPGEAQREVMEKVPGGVARVMRFDSVNGSLSRVVWESPTEEGRLFDVRSMSARGFWWREPMHIASARGTVTLRDSIVTFDMPEARFPSSSASIVGRVIMERGLNFFDVRVDSHQFAFKDMQWLYPRLPSDGGGSGTLRIQSQRPKGILWLATNTHIVAPGTRLAGDFGVVTGADSLYFTNVNLRASPLNLQLIQAIVPQKLPLKGLLVGTVEIKGALSSLDTRGDVRLSNSSGTSGVKWRGKLDVQHGIASKDFKADVDKFDLALLTAFRPQLNLKGQLTGHVEASGNTSGTVKFAGDLHHYLSGFTSSYNGSGTYTAGAAPGLDIQLNALPLSLEQIAAAYPALERLRGEARGPIRLFGPLDDLQMQADLQTAAGRAQIDAHLANAGATPRYDGTATLYSFRLDRLIDALPQSSVDGKVTFDVSGTGLSDAAGKIGANLASGEIRSVDFRDGHAALTLDHGTARVDSFDVRTLLGELSARGTFGLDAAHNGTVALALSSDSIASVVDDAAVPTAGRVRGSGTMTGSLESFDLKANVDVAQLHYADVTSRHVVAQIAGTGVGGSNARFTLHSRADTVIAFGVRADSSIADVTYGAGRGTARLASGSADSTVYVASGDFTPRDHGLGFTIDQLLLGKQYAPWALAHPVSIAVDDHGLTADSLDIARTDGGRVHAGGHIAWHDASHAPEPDQFSDFRLNFSGVPFTEFALVTSGARDVRGTLDGHVRLTGNAVAPLLDADATINNLGFRDAALDQLTGSFTYADKRVNVRIDAEKDGRRVLFADGVVPLNLAFLPVANRKLAEPLRFLMQADSLPATFLTSWVDGFSNVQGRLDGELAASGTTAAPTLSGAVTLQDGDATWDITNVRYRDVTGTVKLDGERTAHVDANLKANGGSGHVTGSIDLKQLTNPGFNLLLNAQNLLASKRRDVEFTASGNVQLLGHFREPIVTGVIDVEQGTMFLDELYRRVQIV